MGHKVHPTGIRLGIAKDWNSKWYAGKKEYASYLTADLKVREMLRKRLAAAGISRILIERPAKTARVTIHTARPGVVIGKRGEDIEKLRKDVTAMMGVPAHINVTEVRKPELDAQLVAESIAQQLERRIMFRRAMKRAVGNAMRLGALGIKVNVAGRLNGAEIARSEWYREGRVPLHTLRADVDYGFAEAKTTYGIIGIKTWIYKGEIFDFAQVGQEKQDDSPRGNERGDRGDRDRTRGPRRDRGDREARDQTTLQPTRTKYHKIHKGRNDGLAWSGNAVSFGEFGLKATTTGQLTARQIEAGRRSISRHVKRGGKMWIRVFPDKPITKKPIEVRMGSGKGSVEYWVAQIQPGRVIYEIEGVPEETAREAFRLAAAKLSVTTTFVTRTVR